MPEDPFSLLDYGIAGALVLETIVFLYFWSRRDKDYNQTIKDVDDKNSKLIMSLVKQHGDMANKYDDTVRENVVSLRDVTNAMTNLKDSVNRCPQHRR